METIKRLVQAVSFEDHQELFEFILKDKKLFEKVRKEFDSYDDMYIRLVTEVKLK